MPEAASRGPLVRPEAVRQAHRARRPARRARHAGRRASSVARLPRATASRAIPGRAGNPSLDARSVRLGPGTVDTLSELENGRGTDDEGADDGNDGTPGCGRSVCRSDVHGAVGRRRAGRRGRGRNVPDHRDDDRPARRARGVLRGVRAGRLTQNQTGAGTGPGGRWRAARAVLRTGSTGLTGSCRLLRPANKRETTPDRMSTQPHEAAHRGPDAVPGRSASVLGHVLKLSGMMVIAAGRRGSRDRGGSAGRRR